MRNVGGLGDMGSRVQQYIQKIKRTSIGLFNPLPESAPTRLYHKLANPSPGFLGIPILKGVVGQLLAFIGPAIHTN